MTRRFKHADGTSSKIWEVTDTGSAVTVGYARIGADGQAQKKPLASPGSSAPQASKARC
jgi:predicted DNA-binding WGR domain protein